MNKEKMLEEMGGIRPEFVEEARPKMKKKQWFRIGAAAAAIIAAAGAAIVIPKLIKGGKTDLQKQHEYNANAMEGNIAAAPAEPSSSPEPAYTVLTISSATYGAASLFGDIGEIEYTTVDKDKVGTKKTIEFAGQQFEIEYKQTYTRKVGEYTLDEYRDLSDGATESANFLLWPDDTIYAARTNTFKFDIGEGKSKDEIRQICENTLKDYVDFSSYEYCDAIGPDDYDPYSYYHYYDFLWHNKINGVILPGCVILSIDTDGSLAHLLLWNTVPALSEEVPDDLNRDSLIPAVEDKLNEIYGENLNSYELFPNAELTRYEGQYCVEWGADVHYRSDFDENDSARVYFIILLDHND